MRNLLSVLEPHSMGSLGHQHYTKKLSPKIALQFKVLRESEAMLPKFILLITSVYTIFQVLDISQTWEF